MEGKRTVREFVKGMSVLGRTDTDILAVASNTRWAPYRPEIKAFLKEQNQTVKKRLLRHLDSGSGVVTIKRVCRTVQAKTGTRIVRIKRREE